MSRTKGLMAVPPTLTPSARVRRLRDNLLKTKAEGGVVDKGRKFVLGFVAIGAATIMYSAAAPAQSFPTKPVRVVVPFVAGAGGDIASRIVTTGLSALWGQPVVVDNRAGAGESLGADVVAKSVPDGYTLLICSANAMAFRPYLAKVVPYDSLKDFTPVIEVADATAAIVVNPSFPANSLKEVLDYARANPGKLSYGTSGIGTSHHLSAEQLQKLAGISMVHVPYKSGIQPFNDVMAGLIPMSLVIMGTLAPQLKTGKVKVVAVISNERNRRIPDVPTVSEIVPGFYPSPNWMGLFAPPGLPQPLLRRMHADAAKALAQPEAKSRLEQMGFDVVPSTPESFAAMIARDFEFVGRVVKAAGIQPTE